MRILFITATRLGDAVLSTGVLDRLLTDYPNARVTVACGPAAAGLFEAVPNLERVIVLEKMLWSLHWVRLWWLCAGRLWDVVVDLRNTPMSYLIPKRRGWRMGRSQVAMHRVERMARVIGLGDDPPAPRLWIDETRRARARQLIPDGGHVLALGPTANWRAKVWPQDRFIELVARLTAPGGLLPDARVAVFGRDDERPSALRLIEAIPAERRIDLMGRIDLLDIGACMERADLYVGNDSGLMHMAAAAGAPTLGLFGPSKETFYAPWGEFTSVVRGDDSYDTIFPAGFNHRTSGSLMEGLSVDRVEAAARDLLARARSAA